MPLAVDALLNARYRILSELGHGGMGAVYFGRDENIGVEVAIKENLFVSPEAEKQFKREATLLASLRHPNLPRVTDHFVIPGEGQYLVMDFVPGEDLKQRLEHVGGPLPEAEVVRWAGEILDALAYLHSLQPPIVHRDIKPSNIKITPKGGAVLVDFGLAKIHDIKQQTSIGAKALTPGFAPPEQYGMGRTDPRTDIYSLAATLYNLLTARIPADSLERAIGSAQLESVRRLNPQISEAVARAVERGLSVKPEDRYAAAAEFRAALSGADGTPRPGTVANAAREHQAAPTLLVPSRPARAGNRWLLPVLAIAGLVVACGGVASVGAWWLFTGRGGNAGPAQATAVTAPTNPGPTASDTPTALPSAPPTVSLAPSETTVTVSENTNCRAGPGQPYKALGVLIVGQKARLVGRSVDGKYWIIENPNGRGTCWLWGNYATVEGDASKLPAMTAPPPPPPTATLTPTLTATPVPTATATPTSKGRPTAPSNLAFHFACKAIGTDVLTLTWTDNAANEKGYRVYRDGNLVQKLGANSNSYQEVVPSVFHAVYGVEAFNDSGTSDRPTIPVTNKCR